MTGLKSTKSIITLYTNSLNNPVKRQRLPHEKKTQDQTPCCLEETHFKYSHKHKYYTDINLKNFVLINSII